MRHLVTHEKHGLIAQLVTVEPSFTTPPSCPAVSPLLNDFQDLFAPPSGFPPSRSIDHKVTLTLGTNPHF